MKIIDFDRLSEIDSVLEDLNSIDATFNLGVLNSHVNPHANTLPQINQVRGHFR